MDSFAPKLRKVLVVATFAVATVGTAAYDAAHGVWPGRDVPTKGLRRVASGEWFRDVEARLGETTAVGAKVRPPYNAALFRAFGVLTTKIVAGADGWFFLRETGRDYPGPCGEELVAEHAALIGVLAEWWRLRGTVLLCVPVPNKETVYPDMLPADARVRPMYAPLLEGLLRAKADFVDLRPALDPAAGLTYLPNDSHWSHLGAERAATAAAAAARALFPAGMPGRASDAEVRLSPEVAHRGDLQRMAGFVEGSDFDRRFLVPTRPRTGSANDGARPLAEGEPIVVCGTSFSRSFEWASLVGASLGKFVVDRTIAAKGPTATLLELARAVEIGETAAPKLIVWEFPEKHVFTRPFEFLEPLRRFAAGASAAAEYDASAERPAAVGEPEVRNVFDPRWDEGTLRGRGVAPEGGGRPDPHIVFALRDPPPGDGSFALAVTASAERRTTLKVFVDYGAGRFSEADAKSFPLAGGGRLQRLLVPLRAPDGRTSATRVRVDPANDDAPFVLAPLRLAPRRR